MLKVALIGEARLLIVQVRGSNADTEQGQSKFILLRDVKSAISSIHNGKCLYSALIPRTLQNKAPA